ncbi:BA75_02360T0 [Komagataella pastoris]|uniref:BA75_02360T0 n=1 Tax=Komagataella pastoris TaxID=4922 RepID=A0A1B2JCV1_PICPA|nr:BA75_02360T0 [Komagataella pastoris]
MVFQVNVPVGEARKGETAPRRYYKVKDAPVLKPSDCNPKVETVYDYLVEMLGRYEKNKAMAWRELIDIHTEKKKVNKMIDGELKNVEKEWQYYELSDYKFITYKELQSIIFEYGRGLVELGIKPNQEERLHIYASTSHKWFQTYLATQTQNIPIVTAYDTLGESGLTHSLVQTGSVAIFTNNDLLHTLINPLKKAVSVRFIIHTEKLDSSDKRYGGKLYRDAQLAIDEIKKTHPDIKFISYDEIIALGRDSKLDPIPPKGDDLSCIMYTSGSTGTPKGVVLSHRNVLAGIGGASTLVPRSLINGKDRIIAFLPLAHIFELVFELISLWWGGCLGYANVKTLTDNSIRNCQSDLKAFKPTIMVGVAAVWESVRKGILDQLNKSPFLLQKVFWGAYKSKQAMKYCHIPGTSIIDAVIFRKVKAATGGEIRLLLNGGSPISADTQRFITNLLAPMLLGYGLTETVANTCITDIDNFEFDVAGALTGAVTVKLIDVPEAGYFAKNNQGEVLIQGACVTKEYYKNEQETASVFDYEKGWFSTGDIGEWTSSGQLKVIDRKKNLIKTLNGEYIALEKIESVYRSNSYIHNVCCYADQNKSKPVAIAVPNETTLRKLAVQLKLANAVDEVDLAKVVHDSKLVSKVHQSLLETAKQQGLTGIELIQGVVILDEEWTPQNGFVTSAQKLQRKKILESVKDRVDEVYKQNS